MPPTRVNSFRVRRLMGLRSAMINGLRAIDALIADFIGPVRVLFVIRDLRGFAQIWPIVDTLMQRPRFVISFTIEPGSVLDETAVASHFPSLARHFVAAPRAQFLKWHYVFTTDVSELRMRRWATHFVLHHGQTWGNLDLESSAGAWKAYGDYATMMSYGDQVSMRQLVSPGELQYFSQHAPDLVDSTAFRGVVVGVPKIDGYRSSSEPERSLSLGGLGLDPKRKTLVVTSHWAPKGLFPSLGRQAIDALRRHPGGLNLIVLGHEKLWRDADAGLDAGAKELSAYLESLADSDPLVVFVPFAPDQVPYLALADVLVCDNSSAFVECLSFDKPTLFFDHPQFRFADPRVGDAFRSAGRVFCSGETLAVGLAAILAGGDQFAGARARSLDFLISRRGQATAFVVDLLERMGRVSGPRSLRWRRACRLVDEANAEVGGVPTDPG